MGKIWVGGVGFDIDAKVIRWDEPGGLNANIKACVNTNACAATGGILPFGEKAKNIAASRFSTRPKLRSMRDNPGLKATQAVINQFILHHDGCADADMCFHVLHNERGLSCHFLLDNNGDLYQTLDLAFMAFHAAQFNTNSIGIEISNRGDTKLDPAYYSKKGVNRPATTCKIHGHVYSSFVYTEAQQATMTALARGLAKALPNLPLEYPQDSPGQQSWGLVPNPYAFAGYMGHYHTTTRKWDPGPFDFKKLIKSVRGSMCFPIFPVKADNKDPKAIPQVPAEVENIKGLSDKLYGKNEAEADGGTFPIGPFTGDAQLWHGGVHFAGEMRQRVFSPFPGRLVAARMGPEQGSVGSSNFVLLRHDMMVGTRRMKFFSLYYHLYDETRTDANADPAGAPEWMQSAVWKAGVKPNTVVYLDEPLEAGKVIGRMGLAGPSDASRYQCHFEIFSEDDFIIEIDAEGNANTGPWTFVDGTAGGRFCDAHEVRDLADRDKDDKLSPQELTSFYAQPGKDKLRWTYVLSQSEWAPDPDWLEALRQRVDRKVLDDKQLAEMVESQVTPSLFWTEEFAEALELPSTGEVYHYHPITFVRWVNEEIAKAKDSGGIGDFNEADASGPPEGVTDDFNDTTGESAKDESDLIEDDRVDMSLEDLVQGFQKQ